MSSLYVSSVPAISTWQTDPVTASVTTTNTPAETLTGLAAAAYLFGRALRSADPDAAGVARTNPAYRVYRDDAVYLLEGASATTRVSLDEIANALRYKFGADPLIEFSAGIGLQGYSAADINAILEALNREFDGQFAAFGLLTVPATAPTSLVRAAQTPATSTELREDLTEGGDVYVDRHGAFFINGVRTRAMDLAVTSRLLAQESMAGQYKVLMDDLAERNNLIAAAREIIAGGVSGLAATASALALEQGSDDILAKLTSGQYTDADSATYTSTDFTAITNLLNTLISNKIRDGELDQGKLQAITAQLQNNTEAMTALIKAFNDLNAGLLQGLR
jgi:hypothetical protein